MNEAMQVIKDPIQEALRTFAYLDVEVCLGAGEFKKDWAICSAVSCDGLNGGIIAVFLRLNLAIQAADGFVGSETDSRQQTDVICELTNVLAGSAYESQYGGVRPRQMTTPQLLSPHAARTLWNGSDLSTRYFLRSATQIEGGLIVALPAERHC